MAIIRKTEIVLDQKFNTQSCRHSMNGFDFVLHCHHFTTLYSRLADDCGMLDGKTLLAEVAEDVFGDVLSSYFRDNQIQSVEDRIAIAEQYYAVTGMGLMKVLCAGTESGEVELKFSHVDSGWIKKWGKRDVPVNFITCGYIAGMFSAVYGKPSRSFSVLETQCIVSGADSSKFEIVAK